MSSKTVEEKIEFLNGLTGRTLSIVHYTNWQLTSYGKGSMFAYSGGVLGAVYALTFRKCVDKAFQLAVGDVNNG